MRSSPPYPYRDPPPDTDPLAATSEGEVDSAEVGRLEERAVLTVLFIVGTIGASTAAFSNEGPIAGLFGVLMMGLPAWTLLSRGKSQVKNS